MYGSCKLIMFTKKNKCKTCYEWNCRKYLLLCKQSMISNFLHNLFDKLKKDNVEESKVTSAVQKIYVI